MGCGCMGPFSPLGQVPEGFRRAISYEGQIHWLAAEYAGLFEIGQNWDEIAEKIEHAEELVSRVETDVENALDTAEHADGVATDARTKAEAARAGVAGLDVRLSAVEDVVGNVVRTIVCFGDSFGASSDGWPVQLHKVLPGAFIRNFSVSGAAWGDSVNNFLGQVRTAAVQVAEPEKVTDLVFVGGRNDAETQSYGLKPYVVQALNEAMAAFPNARVTVAPHCWGTGMQSFVGEVFTYRDMVEAAGVAEAARECGAKVLDYAWMWLRGRTDLCQSDGKHPNAAGSKVIAGYLAAGIEGGYSPRYISQIVTMGPNATNAVVTLNGCTVTLHWQGTTASLGTPELPAWAIPAGDVSGMCYTNNGSTITPVFAHSNGSLEIYGKSAGANLAGTGCTMTWTV